MLRRGGNQYPGLTMIKNRLAVTMFNPALVVCDPSGNYKFSVDSHNDQVLFMFRSNPSRNNVINSIYISEIDLSSAALSQMQAIVSSEPMGSFEDARFFLLGRQIGISYTYRYSMAISLLSDYYKIVPNSSTSFLSQFRPTEKNWTFFEHCGPGGIGNQFLAIRTYHPLEIYSVDSKTKHLTLAHQFNWQLPKQLRQLRLRGGAPPVKVGDQYYILLHTAITYRMYILVVDAASLTPKSISSRPILDTTAPIEFPCGMLYNSMADSFVISIGFNDTVSGIYTIRRDAIMYLNVHM
jgi:predicted GH43/DUF377 family glycosyl hydrolase